MNNKVKKNLCMLVAFFCLGAVSLHAETKRALIVGISDYGNAKEDPNKWSNIHGANDVTLLSPLFKQQGYNVTTLTDAQATYSSITSALKKVAKQSQKGDIVYLHFSMHGQPFEDINGDEADGWDEALIPVDAQMHYAKGKYEGKKHLVDDELEKYISQIRSKIGPNGKLYVVLDACHSGTSSRGDDEHIRGIREGFTRSGKYYTPDRSKETNDYFNVPTAKGQSPVTIVEACRSYQLNREVRDADSNVWYGSLSYYIAKAMNDYEIGQSEAWIDYVKTAMSKNKKLRRQNMVIESSNN